MKPSLHYDGARFSLLRFLVGMSGAAFALNFIWEMLQMGSYAGMSGRPWRQTVLSCAFASLGDAGLTLARYLTNSCAFWSRSS